MAVIPGAIKLMFARQDMTRQVAGVFLLLGVAATSARSETSLAPVQSSLVQACLPTRLHSFSRLVLDSYFEGRMSTDEFRRWFSMPNSDYIRVSDCVAQRLDPTYVPEDELPASITLKAPPRGT
jgi:hypothetical protein